MMIMSVGWNYVSELRPPTGLFFVSQVIDEHGESWLESNSWFVRQSSLVIGYYQRSNLVASRRIRRNEWDLALRNNFIRACKWFFTYRKILRHGTSGFIFPPKEGVLRIFIVLKNSLPQPGFNPLTLVHWQARWSLNHRDDVRVLSDVSNSIKWEKYVIEFELRAQYRWDQLECSICWSVQRKRTKSFVQ
jgi:hypothetical protein